MQLKNIKDRAILPRLDDEPRSLESRSTASATDQLMNDEMRYQRMFVDLTSDGLETGRFASVGRFWCICFLFCVLIRFNCENGGLRRMGGGILKFYIDILSCDYSASQ